MHEHTMRGYLLSYDNMTVDRLAVKHKNGQSAVGDTGARKFRRIRTFETAFSMASSTATCYI
jgi:hypothetical protein